MKKKSFEGKAPVRLGSGTTDGDRADGAPRKRLRFFWRRNKLIIRSWLVFGVLLGLELLAFVVFGRAVQTFVTEWTARVTAWSVWLLGAQGQVHGTIVTSKLMTVRIIFECTAVFPVMVYVAAVVAYPCRWTRQFLGIGLGVPVLLIVNQIRLVSLFYIGRWFPSVFDMMHLGFWQGLMIFLTLLVWLVWAARLAHFRET